MKDPKTALAQCAELLASSGDEGFSTRSVVKLRRQVARQLRRLESGRSPRSLLSRVALVDLFAPAGDLQEVAMANGWAAKFLEAAEVIDRAVSKNGASNRAA